MFVCCEACEQGAKACSNVVCPADRPSPLYTIFTFLVNTITAIIVIVNFTGSDSSSACTNGNTKTWNILMLVICGVNMVFSVYLYMRYVQKLREGHGAMTSAWKLFLYDFGVYFYLWFCVFIVVWICMAGQMTSGEKICSSLTNTTAPVVLMIVYLAGSVFVISLSLLTECCRAPRWSGARPASSAAPYPGAAYAPMPQPPMGGGTSTAAPPPVYAPTPVAAPQYQQQPQYQHAAYGQPAPPAVNPAYAQPAQQYVFQQPAYQPQHQQQPPPRTLAGQVGNAVGNLFR